MDAQHAAEREAALLQGDSRLLSMAFIPVCFAGGVTAPENKAGKGGLP